MLLFDYEPVELVDDADVAVVVAAAEAVEAADDVTDTAASN